MSRPLPNVELPPQVVAPEGELTLFTDFANATELGCPVYLVNRTEKNLRLSTDGGSLRLKLNRAEEDGKWQRAQANSYSSCGNSYMSPQLPAGQHVKTSGYVPTRENIGKIRYQLFDADEGEVVSNEGSGRWDPQDVTDSLNDDMSALNEIHEPDAIRDIHAVPLIDDLAKRREVMENGIACLDLISRGAGRSRLLQGLQSLKSVLVPTNDDKMGLWHSLASGATRSGRHRPGKGTDGGNRQSPRRLRRFTGSISEELPRIDPAGFIRDSRIWTSGESPVDYLGSSGEICGETRCGENTIAGGMDGNLRTGRGSDSRRW